MALLIADSGSTKTDWVLLDKNQVLVQSQTIGFNPYFQSSEAIYNEIKINLIPILKEYLPVITSIEYYGAGCSAIEKINLVKDALQLSFGSISTNVNHDLLASARALCGHQKGIACILGTGSNSCLYDGSEVIENVPSVGYFFGDHGSGAHIGKTFIQAYFDENLPIHLKLAFESAGYNRDSILENVYKKPMPSRYLAGLVSFLIPYNEDEFVKNLIKTCFLAFFDSQVSKYSNAKNLLVNSVGSVGYYHKDLLMKAAAEKGYQLGLVIKSPMEGLINFHKH